ncbi:MAG: M42 family peptidase [Kosmotoga sp.]|nr:MAG: M42 family peptidase [Kosmotoga sp.]
MDIDRLTELIITPGIPGREEMVRELITEYINDSAKYEYTVDDLGNIIVRIGGGEPVVGFAAHMDEIGLLITGSNKNGTLNFKKLGGIPDEILPGRHLDVVNSQGDLLDGVIGIVPPHLRTDNNRQNDLCIDVGANNEKELAELGIEVLDYAVFKKHISVLNNKYIAARSLDDRFGCSLLLDVLDNISTEKLKGTLILAWTVQEEIGLVGGQALSNRYLPELFFPVDSFACCSKMTGSVEVGKGPVLRMADSRSVASYNTGKDLLDLARAKNIPLQIGVTGGGTDGIPFMQKGVKTVPLSLAIKYLHSQVEYMSFEDYDNLYKLIMEMIYSL